MYFKKTPLRGSFIVDLDLCKFAPKDLLRFGNSLRALPITTNVVTSFVLVRDPTMRPTPVV